jgi:hypothetical protein
MMMDTVTVITDAQTMTHQKVNHKNDELQELQSTIAGGSTLEGRQHSEQSHRERSMGYLT